VFSKAAGSWPHAGVPVRLNRLTQHEGAHPAAVEAASRAQRSLDLDRQARPLLPPGNGSAAGGDASTGRRNAAKIRDTEDGSTAGRKSRKC
jgi:hypothetical protein